jgi:hypothetical protein
MQTVYRAHGSVDLPQFGESAAINSEEQRLIVG